MEREVYLVKGQTLHGNYKGADVTPINIYEEHIESSGEKREEDGDL